MCFRESHVSLIQQTPPARHTVYEASVLGECTVLLRAAKSPGRGTIYMTQSSEECVVATLPHLPTMSTCCGTKDDVVPACPGSS